MFSPKTQEKSKGYKEPGTDDVPNTATHIRRSDGLTVSKVALGFVTASIALSINIIGFFYLSDRDDIKDDRIENRAFMSSVSTSLNKLVANDIIFTARVINMDARIDKQEVRLEKLYTESVAQWAKSSGP